LGWGICSAALLWGSSTVVEQLCTTVIFASFLHIYLLACVSTAALERSFWLRAILAGTSGFLLVCITMIVHFRDAKHGPSAEESESPDSNPRSNKIQSVPTSLDLSLSLWYSWVCFEFVALCYRMDYAFALESGGVSPMKFRRPEGASPDKKFHAVRVLASFQPVFDKPYYKASIAGVVVSALFLASLIVGLDPDGQILHGAPYKTTGYYLNLIASPIICMVVLALAYWRGEVRKVWGYGERWWDAPEDDPSISGAEDELSKSAPDLEFCDNFTEKDLEDEKYQVA